MTNSNVSKVEGNDSKNEISIVRGESAIQFENRQQNNLEETS